MVLSNHGDRSKALVCDVSVHGCSLNTDAGWLRMGQLVSLRLSSKRSIQAIVRCVRDDRAGGALLRRTSDADAREISGD